MPKPLFKSGRSGVPHNRGIAKLVLEGIREEHGKQVGQMNIATSSTGKYPIVPMQGYGDVEFEDAVEFHRLNYNGKPFFVVFEMNPKIAKSHHLVCYYVEDWNSAVDVIAARPNKEITFTPLDFAKLVGPDNTYRVMAEDATSIIIEAMS